MLHWLAGAKAPEGSGSDLDMPGYEETPETPAPVFAVRAFKHALFGTPQTAQAKAPRRHSNTENARPRVSETRPMRPNMTRPKSTSDAQTFMMRGPAEATQELPTSPTKGILLTPGTATAKRKNVTFGENVLDNEGKRPTKTGLPDDCPGKFPSPLNRSADRPEDGDEPVEKRRARGKLTEAFEQVRDESAQKKRSSQSRGGKTDYEDLADHLSDPQSESGIYWKREYDIYRENTTREVKNLITKQKGAKAFAKTKDEQCTLLADHLKQEQERAEKLEAGAKELAAQVKELEELLRVSQQTSQKYQDEVTSLKRRLDRKDSGRSQSSDGPGVKSSSKETEFRDRKDSVANVQSDTADLGAKPNETRTLSNLGTGHTRRPNELDPSASRKDMTNGDAKDHSTRAAQSENISKHSQKRPPNTRSRSRPDLQAKSDDDVWLPSFSSSSPAMARKADDHPTSLKARRPTGTIGEAPVLKSINVNTLAADSTDDQDAHIRAWKPEYSTAGTASRSNKLPPNNIDKVSKDAKDTWKDAPLLSPSLLDTSPQERPPPPPPKDNENARKAGPHQCKPVIKGHSTIESSLPVSDASSPFVPDAGAIVTPAGIAARAAGGTAALRTSQSSATNVGTPVDATAGQAPPPVPAHREPIATTTTSLNMKPSAVWSSINAPQPQSNRAPVVVGKDGKEVNPARLEAARARIAARGRVVS